jgi:hypothetical protein
LTVSNLYVDVPNYFAAKCHSIFVDIDYSNPAGTELPCHGARQQPHWACSKNKDILPRLEFGESKTMDCDREGLRDNTFIKPKVIGQLIAKIAREAEEGCQSAMNHSPRSRTCCKCHVRTQVIYLPPRLNEQ